MLPQLLVFEAIARLGSLTRAAEEVCLAQPTVSAQLKKLTETVGAPLIEQVGKRLVLTDSGRALLASCEELIALLQRTEQRLALVGRPERGVLQLCATPTGSTFLADLVANFCRAYPLVRVRMEIANRDEMRLRAEGRDRSADDLQVCCETCLGPMPAPAVPDPVPVPGPQAASLPLCVGADTYRVYAPDGHRWVGVGPVALAEFGQEPMILRESGSDSRRVVEQVFAGNPVTRDLEPVARLEVDRNEAVIQALVDGLGIAALADRVVTRARVEGLVRPLQVEGFPVRRRWFLRVPDGRTPSATAALFLAFVRQSLGPPMAIRQDRIDSPA